jgi:hypothetical protein
LQAAWLRVESVAKADAASLQAALIALLTDQAAEPVPMPPRLDVRALTQAIAELKPLLEADDFSALEKFAVQRPLLAELPEALLAPLDAALQDLDMAAGLRACSAIDDWAACQQPT